MTCKHRSNIMVNIIILLLGEPGYLIGVRKSTPRQNRCYLIFFPLCVHAHRLTSEHTHTLILFPITPAFSRSTPLILVQLLILSTQLAALLTLPDEKFARIYCRSFLHQIHAAITENTKQNQPQIYIQNPKKIEILN